MEIIKVENLTFTYPLCSAPAIDNASMTVESGEFVVLCGATGSGKSTLLRLLKREVSPLGERGGTISYKGTDISQLSDNTAASEIGFVMQNPEHQIVTDKVWHELAFGLENLSLPQNEIARRIAEMASYFGIESWYEKQISELSGGQKQLLSLASVMVMNPEVLILDEPTAQLDPIAAADFINTLKKLNTDFSLTIIIVEHRLEELVPICDRLVILDKGRIAHNDTPRSVMGELSADEKIISAMPSGVRLWQETISSDPCPLTVRESRAFIENNFSNRIRSLPIEEKKQNTSKVLEFRNIYFRYERSAPDVLNNVSLTVYQNEIFCILGGNGSGKTTLLNSAAGLLKAYSGDISVFGKKLKAYRNQSLYNNCLSLLPQDVSTVFLKNTVYEELAEMKSHSTERSPLVLQSKIAAEPYGGESGQSAQSTTLLPFDISDLYDKHPYDLSGGEQQLAALAKVLMTKPRLLLMDEPTKGLDAYKKTEIIDILKKLKQSGVTIVIVTHDVEFAAACADRCVLFFKGQAVSVDTPVNFFSQNRFYTTAASRMSRGYYDNAVTVEQVAKLCRLNSGDKYADN